MNELEKKAEEKSKTSCVYCEHYTICYKLRHDKSVYNKGCEDFETVKDRGEDDVIAWKEIVPPKERE